MDTLDQECECDARALSKIDEALSPAFGVSRCFGAYHHTEGPLDEPVRRVTDPGRGTGGSLT